VGAPASPGRWKKLGVIYRKKIASAPPAHQVHPQAEQESIFNILLGGGDLELYLVDLDPFIENDD